MATENEFEIGTNSRDFVNMTTWQTARKEDLPAADFIEIAKLFNDSVFDDSFGFSAEWRTDATHYIKIYAPEGERWTGTSGTGVRFEYTGSYTEIFNLVSIGFVLIEGIEFWTGSSSNSSLQAIDINNTSLNENIWIKNCLFYGEGANSGCGIHVNDADSNVFIWNCVFYKMSNTLTDGAGVRITNTTLTVIYDCTFYDCYHGIRQVAGTVIAKNCVATDSVGLDFYGTYDSESCYNASGDTSAPGTNPLTGLSAANLYASIAGGSEDFSLIDDTSQLFNSGTNLSTDSNIPITDDAIFNTRVTNDIGAFTYYDTVLDSDRELSQWYSIFKNGIYHISVICSLENILSDIGDSVTSLQLYNPAMTITTGVIFNTTVLLGDTNRVILDILVAGYQQNEDEAWT